MAGSRLTRAHPIGDIRAGAQIRTRTSDSERGASAEDQQVTSRV